MLQLILLGAFLLPAILFLLTQQNVLRTIGTGNRLMPPGQVWLQLIPLFGLVWQFFVVTSIAGSIRKEMASWDSDSIFGPDAIVVAHGAKRPTIGIGITYCTLFVLATLFNTLNVIMDFRGHTMNNTLSGIVGFLAIAQITCWIIYWVNLAVCRRKLRQKNLATL